jgi:hypothetical protein
MRVVQRFHPADKSPGGSPVRVGGVVAFPQELIIVASPSLENIELAMNRALYGAVTSLISTIPLAIDCPIAVIGHL